MAKSQQTWNKKDREDKKQKKKQAKEKRKEERKANTLPGDQESMIAYVDEFGNISSTPPDPSKKIKIDADSIKISVPRREAIDISNPIRTGIVTFFNTSKGYGFIRDDETNDSIFSHINDQLDHVKENDRVTFEIDRGKKGLNAVRVKLIKETNEK